MCFCDRMLVTNCLKTQFKIHPLSYVPFLFGIKWLNKHQYTSETGQVKGLDWWPVATGFQRSFSVFWRASASPPPFPLLNNSPQACCSHARWIQQLRETLTHKITASRSENTTAKQAAPTDTDSFYFNTHLLFSSHKSLQNRRFAATGSKETWSCLWVADLKETGAFYSHASQL